MPDPTPRPCYYTHAHVAKAMPSHPPTYRGTYGSACISTIFVDIVMLKWHGMLVFGPRGSFCGSPAIFRLIGQVKSYLWKWNFCFGIHTFRTNAIVWNG
jgi:hypothetical protein